MTLLLTLPLLTAFISWAKGRRHGYVWGVVGPALIAGLAWRAGVALPPALGLGGCWALWRTQPPGLFGKAMVPKEGRDVLACLAHHVVAFVFLVPLWGAWPIALPCLAIFVLVALLLAVRRSAALKRGRDIGAETEALQGLVLGIAVTVPLALIVAHPT